MWPSSCGPDLDIGTALARARSMHTLRILSVGLELARGLLGASLDGWRGEDLEQDSGAAALVDGVSARLLAVDQAPAGDVSVLLFRIQIRERLRDRLRHVVNRPSAPTVQDLQRFPLPAPLVFLYGVLIPLWNLARVRSLVGRRCAKRLAGK